MGYGELLAAVVAWNPAVEGVSRRLDETVFVTAFGRLNRAGTIESVRCRDGHRAWTLTDSGRRLLTGDGPRLLRALPPVPPSRRPAALAGHVMVLR